MKYLTCLIAMLLFMGCSTNKEEKESAARHMPGENAPAGATSDLPDMPVRLTDGSFRQMNQVSGKSIIVLFQPDCDHCQREAAAMEQNLAAFDAYQVYFISSAAPPELESFAATYGLQDASNFHFGTTDVGNIVDKFGSIPTPSLYVYSENGELQKEFIGETPIEDILNAI